MITADEARRKIDTVRSIEFSQAVKCAEDCIEQAIKYGGDTVYLEDGLSDKSLKKFKKYLRQLGYKIKYNKKSGKILIKW